MNTTGIVRYSINADKMFDRELRATVIGRSINAFFIEAAREKIAREKRMKAMRLVREFPDPFPTIENPSDYIHTLRIHETEHRKDKIGI